MSASQPGEVADAEWREAFHVPGPGPYLAAHSVGCATRASLTALESSFLDPWRRSGTGAWDRWLQAPAAFREALAVLLDGDAQDFCPQSSVSAGLAGFIGALPRPAANRRIWLAAEQSFPSIGYVLQRASALGYELRLLPARCDPANPESWIEAIDDSVCGVVPMHVHSNTGAVAPLRAIVRRCREVGALCVVDVCQSVGIVPLSLRSLDADAVVGSSIKWLCGGPGAAFLWVRPELSASLAPMQTGWFSHARPFEFDIHTFEDAPGAARFWGGTPSVAPFAIAAASIELLNRIGVPRILAHNRHMIGSFLEALPSHWRDGLDSDRFASLDPERLRNGGTLCIDSSRPTSAPALAALRTALDSRGVTYDVRGATVRLSFHIYNTLEDAQAVAGAFHDLP